MNIKKDEVRFRVLKLGLEKGGDKLKYELVMGFKDENGWMKVTQLIPGKFFATEYFPRMAIDTPWYKSEEEAYFFAGLESIRQMLLMLKRFQMEYEFLNSMSESLLLESARIDKNGKNSRFFIGVLQKMFDSDTTPDDVSAAIEKFQEISDTTDELPPHQRAAVNSFMRGEITIIEAFHNMGKTTGNSGQ